MGAGCSGGLGRLCRGAKGSVLQVKKVLSPSGVPSLNTRFSFLNASRFDRGELRLCQNGLTYSVAGRVTLGCHVYCRMAVRGINGMGDVALCNHMVVEMLTGG